LSGQIGTRSKRHRLRNSAIPFNWVIFGSLLLLAFLLRVVAIITLVAYQDCDAIIYLTNGVDEGLGYTAAIAFCAALMGVFQLLVARAGWIEGTWRWSDVALGVVNLAAVSVILVHGLLYFGFSNPETRAGFTINRLSSHLDNSQFFPPEPMEFDVPDPAYGWEPDPDGGWRNERAELTIRDVPLRKCWTDDFKRAHHAARNPGQPYTPPYYLDFHIPLFHDLDGNELSYTDASRRLERLRPEYPGRKTAPDGTPLLTYEEILAIVEEEWESNEDLHLPAHSTDDD